MLDSQNRHWLLLPWLIDTMMEMVRGTNREKQILRKKFQVAGFLQVTVQAAREQWAM